MGLTETLTVIFIIFKLCNVIDWNWFFVLLPEIIALLVYIPLLIWYYVAKIQAEREIKKLLDEWED